MKAGYPPLPPFSPESSSPPSGEYPLSPVGKSPAASQNLLSAAAGTARLWEHPRKCPESPLLVLHKKQSAALFPLYLLRFLHPFPSFPFWVSFLKNAQIFSRSVKPL